MIGHIYAPERGPSGLSILVLLIAAQVLAVFAGGAKALFWTWSAELFGEAMYVLKLPAPTTVNSAAFAYVGLVALAVTATVSALAIAFIRILVVKRPPRSN